jgi:hypothetical protein
MGGAACAAAAGVCAALWLKAGTAAKATPAANTTNLCMNEIPWNAPMARAFNQKASPANRRARRQQNMTVRVAS